MPLLQKAAELNGKQFGADNPSTLHCQNSLAAAHLDLGQVDRAVPLFEQTLVARRAKLPPDHPDTLRSMHSLAQAYQKAERHEKSLALYTEALQRRRQKLGPDHQDTLFDAIGLSSDQLSQRLFAEAEAVVRECLPLAETKHPSAWFTCQLRCQLGAALVGQAKFAEAERLLVDGYAGLNGRIGTMPVPMGNQRRVKALESLVQLYEGLGKPDEAAKWRRELELVRADTAPHRP